MVLRNHTEVRTPLLAIKFVLSQIFLYGKLARWLAIIQEHDLPITTSRTIKGHDLAFHLEKDLEDSKEVSFQEECVFYMLYVHDEEVELSKSPWYHDVIYYLTNKKCPNKLERVKKKED